MKEDDDFISFDEFCEMIRDKDIGFRVKMLALDCKNIKGFYTYDKADMIELSDAITGTEIIMDELNSEKINKLISMHKRRYADAGIKELKYTAACMALLTLLSFKRIDYILQKEIEREESNR